MVESKWKEQKLVRNTFEEILKEILKIFSEVWSLKLLQDEADDRRWKFSLYSMGSVHDLISNVHTPMPLLCVIGYLDFYFWRSLRNSPIFRSHFSISGRLIENSSKGAEKWHSNYFQTLLAGHIHGKLLIAAFLFNALTWWELYIIFASY